MITWLAVLWLLVPAGAANLAPPLAARLLPRRDAPLDGGLRWRGRRLFGSHKTWRGMVAGTLLAAVVHQVQLVLAADAPRPGDWPLDPELYGRWWMGAWIGFLALAGDAAKSLCKRRVGIAPGRPWFPFDQVDWILGVLAGTWFLFGYGWAFALLALLTGLCISLGGRVLGYWLGINAEWI